MPDFLLATILLFTFVVLVPDPAGDLAGRSFVERAGLPARHDLAGVHTRHRHGGLCRAHCCATI
jgi:hypothetical protein